MIRPTNIYNNSLHGVPSEFQFKLLNKSLATNGFLYKIGVVSSPVCSLCEKERTNPSNISLFIAIIPKNFGQKLLSGFAL